MTMVDNYRPSFPKHLEVVTSEYLQAIRTGLAIFLFAVQMWEDYRQRGELMQKMVRRVHPPIGYWSRAAAFQTGRWCFDPRQLFCECPAEACDSGKDGEFPSKSLKSAGPVMLGCGSAAWKRSQLSAEFWA